MTGKTPAITRRAFGALAAAATLTLGGCAKPAERLARLEDRTLGRIGLAAINTATGATLTNRPAERFAVSSTYRWMLATVILQRVEEGTLKLDDPVPFMPDELLEYAPVVREHADAGEMSVQALCRAVMEVGDHTAANILLRVISGPNTIARLAHTVGDHITRLDRVEPLLNNNRPRDPRDTTTPEAMLGTMQKVLTGDVLKPESREQLITWMKSGKLGLTRLRAGLPKKWTMANTSGTSDNGAVNDVLIAWPKNRPPILIAAYMTGSREPVEVLESAQAEIGRIVVDALT